MIVSEIVLNSTQKSCHPFATLGTEIPGDGSMHPPNQSTSAMLLIGFVGIGFMTCRRLWAVFLFGCSGINPQRRHSS